MQEPTKAQKALGIGVLAWMVAPVVKEKALALAANAFTAVKKSETEVNFREYHDLSFVSYLQKGVFTAAKAGRPEDKVDALTSAKAEAAALDELADKLADKVATTEDELSTTEAALAAANTKVAQLTKEKEQADNAAAKTEEVRRNRRASIRAKARGEGDDGNSQPARV